MAADSHPANLLLTQPYGGVQEEDRKELSLRAIIGLTPEEQDKAVGAAASAEDQYRQAGHAAADQAEAGAEKFTEQVWHVSKFTQTQSQCAQ